VRAPPPLQLKTSVAMQVTEKRWDVARRPWMKAYHQLVHRFGIPTFRYSDECVVIMGQIVTDFELKPRDLWWYP
jgi:hypothetical protein